MEFSGPARPGTGRPAADGELRLFVFPHAGGSSLMCHAWPALFPASWQVRAVDAPGHGLLLGSAPLTDGPSLIGHFLDTLGPELDASGVPFAFFGHSMGALVAYELTRRLQARGAALPVWLGVSACGPHRHDDTGAGRGARPELSLLSLSDDELRRRLAALGATPPQVLADPALWEVFGPTVRADMHLVATWRPAPPAAPLPVPLSAFAGAQDHAAPPQRLAAWAERTEHFVGLRTFPGGHFYFQDDLQALAAAVTADAGAALRGPGPVGAAGEAGAA
ncbi:thioesterase II family protein [Streptomyces monticola]|uniref:Thioesterase II family protein n=1 Tax=Streptomyces monticola TaxID=2666263 RepID=A0ABW2JXJ8_9ACTN